MSTNSPDDGHGPIVTDPVPNDHSTDDTSLDQHRAHGATTDEAPLSEDDLKKAVDVDAGESLGIDNTDTAAAPEKV